MRQDSFDIAVIGAGIFGAWIARECVAAGYRVILVDQHSPGHSRASSGGETRVIRCAYGPDAIYTRMAQQSLVLWQRAFADLGKPELFVPAGTLWMAREGDQAAQQSVAQLQTNGIEHEILDDDQLAQRFPQIAVPPGGLAIHEPGGGALLARRAVQAIAADAIGSGCVFRQTRVLPMAGSGLIDALPVADGPALHAQQYIFACGPWLGKLLPAQLSTRIFPSRQEVFYFGIAAGVTRFSAQQMPAWMDFDRHWYGIPDIEARGFKLACDAHGPVIDPDLAERIPSEAGIAAARDFMRTRFPTMAGAPLLAAEVCQYENTSNGDLLIDRHPNCPNAWIAGGGSGHGFKLAPAVAKHLLARMREETGAEPRFSYDSKGEQQHRAVH